MRNISKFHNLLNDLVPINYDGADYCKFFAFIIEYLVMQKERLRTFDDLLREGGSRATPGRVAILEVLKSADRPLSIAHIAKKLDASLNSVTLYRALDALMDSGIVRRVDLRHSHAHYELLVGVPHHHHIICKKCGAIEDVENCAIEAFRRSVVKRSKQFHLVAEHSLEFFGVCNQCAKRKAP